MRSRSHSASLASLLANVTALHTIFSLFAFRGTGQSDLSGLVIWCIVLTSTYGGLRVLLRRERALRTVLLWDLAGLAILCAAIWLWGIRYPSLLSWLCILLLWAISFFRCYEQILHPIPAEQFMVTFETTALALAVAVLCTSAQVLPGEVAAPPAVGTFLSLVALANYRAGSGPAQSRQKGWIQGHFLLAAILLFIGAVGVFCALLVSGYASQVLTWVTNKLSRAGMTVLNGLGSVLQWLISCFPASEMEELSIPEIGGVAQSDATGGSVSSDAVLYLMIGVVLLASITAVVVVLWKGGQHISLRQPQRTGRIIKKYSLLYALSQTLHHIQEWARFQLSYLAQRNTPAGALVWMEHQLKQQHMARKEGETCHAFLLRVKTNWPNCSEALDELARCLDRYYFGDGYHTWTAEKTRALRHSMRRCIGSTTESTA